MPEPSALVVALDGCRRDRRSLGGKAGALDRLVELGLAVPRSAVLTNAAYRLAVAEGALQELVTELRAAPIPEPCEHAAARDAVDRVFLTAPLPDAVRAAIDELAERARDRPGALLALRSSATAEDLATASFAGQYRSFLGVAPDDVERAVRLTWASLWHPAPRTYRAFRGLGDDVEMAVLAMTMIDPVMAGVLFTRDPTGSSDDVRIESVAGLGEALVSGARTPDVHVLARCNAFDRARDVDPALGELVARGLDLEDRLGRPQDIEWAIDRDDRLWFLQARPITSGPRSATGDDTTDDGFDDGFDIHLHGEPALTTAGIGEMLPGVLPPLIWEATSRHVEDGFRILFGGLGAPLDGLEPAHALVARLRGRAALDLDRMRAAAASIPGGSADELERRYFGEVLTGDGPDDRPRRAGPLQGVRVLLDRHRAVVESEIVIEAIQRIRSDEPNVAGVGDHDLLALRARVHDLAARTTAAEITVAALAAAAYRGVETFLCELVGAEGSALAQRATHSPARRRRGMTTLASDALARGVTSRCRELGVTGLDWPEARARLAASAAGREALERWQSVLARSGSTAVFGGPTWAATPDLAWMAYCGEAEARPDPAEPGATGYDAVDEALRTLARPWLWFARRRFLQREIADATELLERREQTKTALLVLGGFARRIDDEIGRRLAGRRILEESDDVRLLRELELAALIDGAAPTLDTIARRRRRLAAAAAAGPLPRVFRGSPAAVIRAAPHLEGDGAWRGWGASPGWYEGPARVVDSPTTRAIRRGEVLVARTTDASWAPLFQRAGAVVVEEGGPLSHAAIVARELGVPAVVNVPGIVEQVIAAGDGAHLAVDGTAGAVRVYAGHPADELPIVPPRTAPPAPDLNRLGVFITGLIGAGALLSAIVTISETVGSARGARRARRRAGPAGANTADMVLHGTDHVRTTPTGLRPAGWYSTAAAVTAAAAVLALVTGFGEMQRRSAGGAGAVWLAVALLSAVFLIGASAVTARAALAWPAVPAVVRRHLGGPIASEQVSVWRSMPVLHRRVIGALAGVVTSLLVLAVAAEWVLLSVDRRLYDAIDANQYADPWGPHWWGMYFGRPQVVIPVALVVALFTVRCRVLALAYPLTIVFGGLMNLGLGHLVGRQRPPLSNRAD